MFKKNFVFINLFILGLFFCSLASASPKITLSQDKFDFGKIEEGKKTEHILTLTNEGDAVLKVRTSASCGCTKIIEPKKETEVSPGQKLDIKFIFDSTGFSGDISKNIYLYTSDPQNSIIKIPVKANIQKNPAKLLWRFASFGFTTVASAGLADGINPCAFTVLVFFLSFLGFVGYSRREMFFVGGAFVFSVFLTYLLIGVGLFEGFRRLEVFRILSQLIYILTAILAIVLGLISLYDWWIYRKTKDIEKIKIKLPALVKYQIQKVIRQNVDSRQEGKSLLKLIIASFICGILVSLLESVCTGQLYLPTIVYILSMPSLRAKALFFMVLYNLMFIFPLIIIFVCSVTGTTSSDFSLFAKKHLAGIKLFMAILFILLGVSLFFIKK